MAVIVDYHMHLRDPRGDIDLSIQAIERFVERARERGVDEIGFTEHVYYFRQTRPVWSLPYQLERCVFDLDAYCDAIVEAKRRGLPVKLGLEVDWWPPRDGDLDELLAPYPWDYLLGSVHWLEGTPVDQEPGIVERFGVDGAWERYFAALAAAAGSGRFDVLAHPDVVKISGRRPPRETVARLHRGAAAAIGEAGVAVEVSSAGLRKPVGELYPDGELLRACREHGAPITLAADAHEPRLAGEGLDRALEHARAAGYDTVTVFEGRRPRQVPLG